MGYTKLEIHFLGEASDIIQDFTKSDRRFIEVVDPAALLGFTPAYELDE